MLHDSISTLIAAIALRIALKYVETALQILFDETSSFVRGVMISVTFLPRPHELRILDAGAFARISAFQGRTPVFAASATEVEVLAGSRDSISQDALGDELKIRRWRAVVHVIAESDIRDGS